MKKILALTCALATIALLPTHPILAVGGGILAFSALMLQPQAGCADATLVLPMLTGKVMEAFRVEVPELTYFSTDFGMQNGAFAQPVKFGQEVISHLAQIPTVHDYTPGDDITSSQDSTKDLVKDIKVKIDTAKIVKIEVPAADAATLLIMPAFQQALVEAGKSLGREVVAEAMAQVSIANFSHELVAPAEDIAESITTSTMWAKLGSSRIRLNKQYAKWPRFVVANSDWVGSLGADLRVSSSLGYNQRTTSDPYARYQNIEGYNEVREYSDMPTTDNLVGFAFEKRAIHLAVRQLVDGLDMAQQLGVPVPIMKRTETDPDTGLAFTSLLFVDTKTLNLNAAFIVAFGIRAGRTITDPLDPAQVLVTDAMNRCGLRLVSASNS